MKVAYKKWLGFSGFLLLSTILWFAFKYSHVYSQNTVVDINFTNIPVSNVINDDIDYTLDVELTGSGFKLLAARYFTPTIDIDFKSFVKNKKNHFYLDSKDCTGLIKDEFASDYKVEFIHDEIVTIDVLQFLNKKVPLISNFNIEYINNLQPVRPTRFKPDSVLITGNNDKVSVTDYLEISIDDVQVNDTLQIVPIDLEELYPQFKIEPKNADFIIETTEMTEGSFQLPVTVVNAPNDVNIKLIPSFVELVYSCRLKDYELINKSDFTIQIDFLNLKDAYNNIKPSLVFKNEKVSSTRITPQQIQVLVIK